MVTAINNLCLKHVQAQEINFLFCHKTNKIRNFVEYMKKVLFLLFVISIIVSCGGKQTNGLRGEGDTLHFKYAQNIVIVRQQDATIVELKNPWKEGTLLHRYILLSDSNVSPGKAVDGVPTTVIRRGRHRAIVCPSAHAALLKMLNVEQQIVGVCDLKYMVSPHMQLLAKMKNIADCGESMNPEIEKMMETRADLVLVSPFENSGGYGKLDKTGIAIIECADYMETSPLGRAEWMKFYGLLFGCEQTADSLFMEVEKNYMELTETAKKEHERPTILTEKLTGTVWYVPGGQSTMGRMIADAGATYPFSDNKQSGSLALPLEKVLEEARSADIWLIKYNAPTPLTYSQMLGENKGYAMIKAFKTRHVYGCNAAIKPIFEETPFRPDWLLQELVRIAHPSKQPFVGHYFEPLN